MIDFQSDQLDYYRSRDLVTTSISTYIDYITTPPPLQKKKRYDQTGYLDQK